MHTIDVIVQQYFITAHTPKLTEWMYLLSMLFDVSIYSIIVSLAVAFLAYLFQGIRYFSLFILSMVSGTIIVLTSKYFFNIARPTNSVISAFGQSFPSYHATIATIFFGMSMYIFDPVISRSFSLKSARIVRIVFNSLCIFLIFLVAFSRVYLGVHWVSDVFGGIVFGIAICFISIYIFKHWLQKQI